MVNEVMVNQMVDALRREECLKRARSQYDEVAARSTRRSATTPAAVTATRQFLGTALVRAGAYVQGSPARGI
ncbi:MAG: hypothetical protein ACRDJW_07565 [Thermomicrobiales bacterium]